MEKLFLSSLAHYNAYANQTLLETAVKIPYKKLDVTPSPSRHSALTLIKHTLDTEAFFLAQLLGEDYQPGIRSLTSMEEIQEHAKRNSEKFLSYVDALDDAVLAREVDLALGTPPLRLSVWQVLLQVFMHSAQHRGELSIILSSIGYPLPIDDIIIRFVEESGQTWIR
jgi:uncharacterized damage-inducible protein DinB